MSGKSGLALVHVAGSPLKMLWTAGTFGNYDAKFKKKFNRRKYVNVSLIEKCELIRSKCCEGSINMQTTSSLLLGLARIHHRQCSWLLEDAKNLMGAYEELKKAQSLTVGLANLDPTSFRSIDVPPSRPGHVDLPSLDYSECNSLLQLNQSSIDKFRNAYLKDGDYLSFGASSTGQDDSMYAEVSDAHTAHPSEITLPDPPRIPKDIMDPGLDESFGDGGMCSCFDPDPLPDHSIVSHDQQIEESEPLGDVSQSREITAPSMAKRRRLAFKKKVKRRKMAFEKQVFDKETSLLENNLIPELLTTSYKTRPGPRANKPAPILNTEHFSINSTIFLDQRFSKLLKGWDGDAAMSNPTTDMSTTDILTESSLSQSELEKSRISPKDDLTQKSDQASGSRLTTFLRKTVTLQPGKSGVGGGKPKTNPGGLSPIADVEAEEYTCSGDPAVEAEEHIEYVDAGMMNDGTGGMMDDDDTPEQPLVKELPEQATTPQPLNRSTVDQFAETVEGKLVQGRSLVFSDIAPPRIMDKSTAASKFFKLLSAVSQHKHGLKLEQEEPYGAIKISK